MDNHTKISTIQYCQNPHIHIPSINACQNILQVYYHHLTLNLILLQIELCITILNFNKHYTQHKKIAQHIDALRGKTTTRKWALCFIFIVKSKNKVSKQRIEQQSYTSKMVCSICSYKEKILNWPIWICIHVNSICILRQYCWYVFMKATKV
jgi:hypothetical protein